MRLIADGVVDREGVDGLARRLAYSPRQLRRLLLRELGAGPLALARAQRAQTARLLVETTDVPLADVAFAAGFSSVRQFNDTIREVFARAPRELRRHAHLTHDGRRAQPNARLGTVALRLPYRPPFDAGGLLDFFAARAVPGVEEADGTAFRRTLSLPHGTSILELSPADGFIAARFHLADLRDLALAVSRCRAFLDLDADPLAIDAVLGADPLLAPAVRQAPGKRVPGAVDGTEIAIRAVLGQQVSVAAARRTAARIAADLGDSLPQPLGTLAFTFPSPEKLAEVDAAQLPLPAKRARVVQMLATAVAEGHLVLDAGADREETRRRLLEIPGVGAWTAEYVAMRALSDTDAFPAADLGVMRRLTILGAARSSRAAVERAERWRPWRAYAVQHLWST
jgi:AraC family transcriptional regulator of adaptative response / DNA-3-methyladenine glycosylase II